MSVKFDQVRKYALALPEASEAPHHERTSFRVRGRIFATSRPDGGTVNIFVDADDREAAIVADPVAVAPLGWGGKVVGVTVTLAAANPARVAELLQLAYCLKAPKRLVAAYLDDLARV